jgi:hypothetical protein
MQGNGLIDLVPQALDADIPVLIAVPKQRFAGRRGKISGPC